MKFISTYGSGINYRCMWIDGNLVSLAALKVLLYSEADVDFEIEELQVFRSVTNPSWSEDIDPRFKFDGGLSFWANAELVQDITPQGDLDIEDFDEVKVQNLFTEESVMEVPKEQKHDCVAEKFLYQLDYSHQITRNVIKFEEDIEAYLSAENDEIVFDFSSPKKLVESVERFRPISAWRTADYPDRFDMSGRDFLLGCSKCVPQIDAYRAPVDGVKELVLKSISEIKAISPRDRELELYLDQTLLEVIEAIQSDLLEIEMDSSEFLDSLKVEIFKIVEDDVLTLPQVKELLGDL